MIERHGLGIAGCVGIDELQVFACRIGSIGVLLRRPYSACCGEVLLAVVVDEHLIYLQTILVGLRKVLTLSRYGRQQVEGLRVVLHLGEGHGALKDSRRLCVVVVDDFLLALLHEGCEFGRVEVDVAQSVHVTLSLSVADTLCGDGGGGDPSYRTIRTRSVHRIHTFTI